MLFRSSEQIYRLEAERVFGRCWIYVGHGSEIPRPGDFRTRTVAGRPVVFSRTDAGEVRCLFNTCRHRGAVVCRERSGNAKRFNCLYHGWRYDNAGNLTGDGVEEDVLEEEVVDRVPGERQLGEEGDRDAVVVASTPAHGPAPRSELSPCRNDPRSARAFGRTPAGSTDAGRGSIGA